MLLAKVKRSRVEPAALRRAVGFVDANAERQITVQDMATAASATPRAWTLEGSSPSGVGADAQVPEEALLVVGEQVV